MKKFEKIVKKLTGKKSIGIFSKITKYIGVFLLGFAFCLFAELGFDFLFLTLAVVAVGIFGVSMYINKKA